MMKTKSEISTLDGARVRTEYEIKLIEKLRLRTAQLDCMLVHSAIGWIIAALAVTALIIVLNLK